MAMFAARAAHPGGAGLLARVTQALQISLFWVRLQWLKLVFRASALWVTWRGGSVQRMLEDREYDDYETRFRKYGFKIDRAHF
jgi:hypothetical protein